MSARTHDGRRRRFYHGKVNAAASASEGMSHAFDYLRAVLNGADGQERDRVAEAVARYLLRTADTVEHRRSR